MSKNYVHRKRHVYSIIRTNETSSRIEEIKSSTVEWKLNYLMNVIDGYILLISAIAIFAIAIFAIANL